MKNVLLANSYFYRFDPKQWKAAQPYPPLGTITAAALLREHGFQVSLFDANLSIGPEELQKHLDVVRPEVLVIYDDGFNYLTKMCLSIMREAAFDMIGMAKGRGMKIMVCSSDSTDHAEEYLNRGADFIIMGEGEETLLELLQQQDPCEVKGLAFLKKGKTVKTGNRPVLKDLDTLPMAAWDLVNIESYRKIWQENHAYFSLNIATTRGCPFKCNWCAKPIYGNRYHSRSAEKVAGEIAYLISNFKPDHLWMCDDIFGLKPGWVKSFNLELEKRNIAIKYKIQSRADLLLKEDTINDLVQSGLDEVWIGAESGSQKILDAMDKGTRVEQIYKAAAILKSKGVKVGFFLQFGYLGETKKDIGETIKLVKTAIPDSIGVSVSYPLPGTPFYEKVRTNMKSKQNWSDSDDLDTMYNSPYSSAYYKTLHRFVHKMFRRERARYQFRKLLKNKEESSLKELLTIFYYEPVYWIYWLRMKLQISNSLNR